MSVPDITLGTRGAVAMDLIVDLRQGSHHSGHWGGLLADPGVILAHAIASIVSQDGRILVAGWTPAVIPDAVRQASHDVVIDDVPGTPVPDPGWGEPGLSAAERIYIWSSVIVLASISGQPEGPVNAVSGNARARLQIRHTVDLQAETIVPALRAHLDERSLGVVQVVPVTEQERLPCLADRPRRPVGAPSRAVDAADCRPSAQHHPQHRCLGPIRVFQASARRSRDVDPTILRRMRPARTRRTRVGVAVSRRPRADGRRVLGHRRAWPPRVTVWFVEGLREGCHDRRRARHSQVLKGSDRAKINRSLTASIPPRVRRS